MSVELNEQFCLRGVEVSLDEAEALKRQGLKLIDAHQGPIKVDLGELQRANSVTVALLVAWYRRAILQQKPITFVNLSEDLHNIVEFSGLSRVLLPSQTS